MTTIHSDKAVTLSYVMRTRLEDGSEKDHPEATLTFIFGVDRQVPALEKALEGRRAGESLRVDIPPSEIYGVHDPALIREIPKKGLIKQRLKQGQYYRQMKMGSLISFKVLEMRENSVLADFNRPMAGIAVTMDLEIKKIRDATQKEIEDAIEAQMKKNIGCG